VLRISKILLNIAILSIVALVRRWSSARLDLRSSMIGLAATYGSFRDETSPDFGGGKSCWRWRGAVLASAGWLSVMVNCRHDIATLGTLSIYRGWSFLQPGYMD
jgi:hypothetical protein